MPGIVTLITVKRLLFCLVPDHQYFLKRALYTTSLVQIGKWSQDLAE